MLEGRPQPNLLTGGWVGTTVVPGGGDVGVGPVPSFQLQTESVIPLPQSSAHAPLPKLAQFTFTVWV